MGVVCGGRTLHPIKVLACRGIFNVRLRICENLWRMLYHTSGRFLCVRRSLSKRSRSPSCKLGDRIGDVRGAGLGKGEEIEDALVEEARGLEDEWLEGEATLLAHQVIYLF